MDNNVKSTVEFKLNIDIGDVSKLDDVSKKSDDAEEKVKKVREEMRDAQIDSIAFLTALSSVASGTNSVMSSLTVLLPMTDETRESFQKLSAGINLFVGSVQLLKGASKLYDMLSAAQQRNAIAALAAAAANNPLLLILGAAAVGTAAGVATGYFYGQRTTNVENNFYGTPNEEIRSASSVMNTGGWY